MRGLAVTKSPLILIAMLLALVAGALVVTAAPAANADTTTDVAFDSFVKQFNTSFNGGAATTLQADSNPGFVKYGLVQVAEPAVPAGEALDAAYLRVYVTGTIPAGATLTADLVGNSWTETGVTYANQPAVVSNGPSSVAVVAGWNAIPVAATPGAVASYRVRTNVTQPVNFSSRENADGNSPEVLLDTHAAPPPPPPAALKVIGMSSPDNVWDQRLAEVGPQGVTARRIYANLTSTGNDQAGILTDAHAAGLLPVISYKLPSVSSAISGSYDSWAAAAGRYLQSFGHPTVVTFWHEPYGDMTGAQFVSMQARLVPIVQANCSLCEVGPILNGWLLDNKRADFESFISPALLNTWDFVGIDTYQSGTQTAPGSTIPGDRVAPLLDVLSDDGHPDMPIGIGEYNGFTAQAIADSGETFLSTPQLQFALCWNSDGGKGVHLSGDRLAAYQATKADPRAQQ